MSTVLRAVSGDTGGAPILSSRASSIGAGNGAGARRASNGTRSTIQRWTAAEAATAHAIRARATLDRRRRERGWCIEGTTSAATMAL
jgi:hypothetical protein